MTGPDPQLPLVAASAQGRLAARVTCRRCKRPLHDPESRLLRLGPECRDHTGHTTRHQVEQDTLPGVYPDGSCGN
ncbi:DUF6011 domain-containing protein [Kitasatospora sp. NBC_00240]|nr:DUF6011 domain-containing protein [Kitasatospora sp. NBC_00240]